MSHEEVRVLLSVKGCGARLDESSVRSFLGDLPESVLIIQCDSRRVVYVNRRAEELFLLGTEESAPPSADELFIGSGVFAAFWGAAMRAIEADGLWRGQWEFLRRDGSAFGAEVSASLRHDQRSYLVVCLREHVYRTNLEDFVQRANQRLARRVTERTSELISKTNALVRAENELRRTEQLLAALLRNLDNYAVLTLTAEGCVRDCNAGVRDILGYSPQELERRHVSELYLADNRGAEQWRELLNEASRRNGLRAYDWLSREDGSRVYARVELLPLRDDNGALTGYLMLLRDDTEQRQMRDKLQDKEHLAAAGAATSILAHEIKNPLNGMSTTVQLLERSLRGGAPPTVESMMGTVRDLKSEIARLQSLLAGFQAISRPQRLIFQTVELCELLHNTVALIQPECAKQKIDIVEEYASGMPAIEADADKLKQAFINLMKNACEAMPQGGTLTVKASHGSDGVGVEIIDTGKGIPEGVDIFELFSSTKADGTGLGMVIVQQIVLAHNGTISYTSKKASGTTFRVLLAAGAAVSRGRDRAELLLVKNSLDSP